MIRPPRLEIFHGIIVQKPADRAYKNKTPLLFCKKPAGKHGDKGQKCP